jgi:hypothetical protein
VPNLNNKTHFSFLAFKDFVMQMQTTDFTAFDTIVIKPDTQLQAVHLFKKQGKAAHLNNLTLPVQLGHKYMFEYLKGLDSLVVRPTSATNPTPGTAATEQLLLEWQREFQASSHFVYKIQNVEFAQIPLASLVPYNIDRIGGQYRFSYKPMLQLYKLLDKIQLEQGSVDFIFSPATNFSTCGAAFASALPSMQDELGAGVVGYTFQLFMRGTITRPIAQYAVQA